MTLVMFGICLLTGIFIYMAARTWVNTETQLSKNRRAILDVAHAMTRLSGRHMSCRSLQMCTAKTPASTHVVGGAGGVGNGTAILSCKVLT